MATNTDAIASTFLRALGAPDTPLMRKAMQAWMIKEGISSSKYNNPWNLHGGAPCTAPSHYCPGGVNLPGAIGRRYAGPGDQNVVVFATQDAGVRASAANLLAHEHDNLYGYRRVIAYARAGDPVGFLNALALSSWSEGRYGAKGSKGANSLITIYNGLTGQHNSTTGYRAMAGIGAPGPGPSLPPPPPPPGANGSQLAAFGGAVSFPVGKIITVDDVNTIIQSLYAADKKGQGCIVEQRVCFFADKNPLAAQAAETVLRNALISGAVGKPWNKALQDQLAGTFFASAGEAVSNPLVGIGETFAKVVGAAFDPGTWARVLALLLGAAMALWGGMNLARAS